MSGAESSNLIPLRTLKRIGWAPTRRGEPLTLGVPLPSGAVSAEADLHLEAGGHAVALQVRPLDYWPDRSFRWVLLDFLANADLGELDDYVLRIGAATSERPAGGIRVDDTPGSVVVTTGRGTFEFSVGKRFPFSGVSIDGEPAIAGDRSSLRIVDAGGSVFDFSVREVRVVDRGPVRAEIEVLGGPDRPSAPAIDVVGRIEVFAGGATARLAVTLRNPRRARHPSNQWVLGDPGSVFIRSASLVLEPARGIDRVWCAAEPGSPLAEMQRPFEIYQDSSGGDHWDGPVHRNRDARVPLQFRGYRIRSGGYEHRADRANPVVCIDGPAGRIAVAVPEFWENFPRAIDVTGPAIEVGLFPSQFNDIHELQGGEQKTHVMVIAFDDDPVSDPPLAWCHDPAAVYPSPEWCCATGAVPFLVPAAEDSNAEYLALIAEAHAPAHGFLAKREAADEYGWRNFGDLHADHESAFLPADRRFVSHYNNQYDAVAGFATQFLRTGDLRWWRLMTDLARHVADVDIYRTQEDKSAYNGGLFWHTYHYVDAGTSTHRSYPRGVDAGGGPSAEHNYNVGLMLHYFLTGQRSSRDAAIGLGRWVLNMDDGGQTVFRWLARGATGLASGSGSTSYHGPGRGAANSIMACLVAHRLSGDGMYLAKAEELIRRCIHPLDDVDARNLLDAERRWFYTVFLQALGTYLHQKAERREFDDGFGYAQASLRRYAKWMAEHERPYLDHPEILEYPTETWAAQDMRKAEVFLWAALHSEQADRALFLDRARFFFSYSVRTLSGMPGWQFTRPLVLLLSNGVRLAWFEKSRTSLPSAPSVKASFDPPARFEPQRVRAMRRAAWICAAGAGAALIALASLLRSL